MEYFVLIFNSLLLGIGLAIDAFSVSLANGFQESNMKKIKMVGISSVFGTFQAVMPMIGWVCVHTIMNQFKILEYFIPWIALALLSFLGGKMIYSFVKERKESKNDVENKEALENNLQVEEKKEQIKKITFGVLMIQGIATSIDALSVGFTIAGYIWWEALISALIIGVVTFALCMIALLLGKKIGSKFADKATLIGGIILIAIGIEIFITNMIELYA